MQEFSKIYSCFYHLPHCYHVL